MPKHCNKYQKLQLLQVKEINKIKLNKETAKFNQVCAEIRRVKLDVVQLIKGNITIDKAISLLFKDSANKPIADIYREKNVLTSRKGKNDLSLSILRQEICELELKRDAIKKVKTKIEMRQEKIQEMVNQLHTVT